MDLTGITNVNEYYTNHYLAAVFADNADATIKKWGEAANETDSKTPWSMLNSKARDFYAKHDKFTRSHYSNARLKLIKEMADGYLEALGYGEAHPEIIELEDDLKIPIYLEITKDNGAPALWVILAASKDMSDPILEKQAFYWSNSDDEDDINLDELTKIRNEDLANKIFYSIHEPPRFLVIIGMSQIALLDRNKWNDKRYLQFELEDIFTRHETSTLQAMAVLLHKDSLCPKEGKALIDELDESSHKNANEVSNDLKYALRESIELLGNEVLYDMRTRQGIDLDKSPVDSAQLTIECLRYMYRMLFVLFIESRAELGYAPRENTYLSAYSLESLRDIADNINENVEQVGDGYYLYNSLTKLYDMIYNGYPATEEECERFAAIESKKDCFAIPPLKAHIFDPEYTKLISQAKIRNSVMLRIVKLMSLTREKGGRNSRRGRISYANLGINQMGAVYEALLSYRGFIAEQDLYEVKKAGTDFDILEVGYFVSGQELEQYSEEERVYDTDEQGNKHLLTYVKGSFVYRLAGREREKSASYYTPECLTKCLVKYALKELLQDKTADEILQLTVCEPAMGSAAFLNEAINQLAEAYLTKKQEENNELIKAEDRLKELQKVKMYIADRNVYGIDLNPIAVELAEVSLWLNTIYEGGYVPWFGTQLINGNSLIGARKQCYRVANLKSTAKGMRWYEMAPERVAVGTKCKNYADHTQIYHFLLGDPGMSNYTDKVIKELEPENIKKIKAWNKEFIRPYSSSDVEVLLRLSTAIDKLWDEQVENRLKLEEATRDSLSVYGHKDSEQASHTSIREKDRILHQIYKSEQQQNAGAYARLKFAMDYWCALWFWPIEKADLLPSRDAFLFDMDLILNGTLKNVANQGQPTLFSVEDLAESVQLTQVEQMKLDFSASYCQGTVVDIPMLCKNNERLALVQKIADQNHFMHWELEFADLFKERGGFDFVVGNPPWIKLTWNEQDVLSEYQPILVIKPLSINQFASYRNTVLFKSRIYNEYIREYQNISSQQNFLGATSNYQSLSGAVNLYKCFLPQSWMFARKNGVSAFIHPDGVYDDPKGGKLRVQIYNRLVYHFQFRNELRLFAEVHHSRIFSLNIYSNTIKKSFDNINDLYIPDTIDECYDNNDDVYIGIKDSNGKWNTKGCRSRVVTISSKELDLFGRLFDESSAWSETKLLSLHSVQLLNVIKKLSTQKLSIGKLDGIYISEMWNETAAQKDNTIVRSTAFAEERASLIMVGAQIGVLNPLFKTPRKECTKNSDFDTIDLTNIGLSYLPRSNYSIKCNLNEYYNRIPIVSSGKHYDEGYRIFARRMIDPEGYRTIISALIPPGVGHINGVVGVFIPNEIQLLITLACMSSLVTDYLIKISGKSNLYANTIRNIPLISLDSPYIKDIVWRVLRLNCLTNGYIKIWNSVSKTGNFYIETSCKDHRVKKEHYNHLEWDKGCAVRSDYVRRLFLLEIDVLVAMAYGISLDEFLNMYRIQFHVLNAQEYDTWYDVNGRIVFTINRSLVGVGVTRKQWENNDEMTPIKRGEEPWDGIMKNAPAGYVFEKKYNDDTMPGGPIERTIEYVAPFDRCDREKDYETAWRFFEEKYKYVKEV